MSDHHANGHIPPDQGGYGERAPGVEYPALVYRVQEVRLAKGGSYTATLHRKHYKSQPGFDPMWTTTDVMVVEVNEGQARIAEQCLKEDRDIPVTVHWPSLTETGELEDSVEWVDDDDEEEGEEEEEEEESEHADTQIGDQPNGLSDEATGEG